MSIRLTLVWLFYALVTPAFAQLPPVFNASPNASPAGGKLGDLQINGPSGWLAGIPFSGDLSTCLDGAGSWVSCGSTIQAAGSLFSRTNSIRAADLLNPLDYGALGLGPGHPISGVFASQSAAAAYCPDATWPSEEMDYCAVDKIIQIAQAKAAIPGTVGSTGVKVFFPPGNYAFAEPLTAHDVTLAFECSSPKNTVLAWNGTDGIHFGQADTTQGGSFVSRDCGWANSGSGGIAIVAQFNIAVATLTLNHNDFIRKNGGWWSSLVSCLACSYADISYNHAAGLLNSSGYAFLFTDNNTLVGHYGNKWDTNYIVGFSGFARLTNASTTGMQGQYFSDNNQVQGGDFLTILNTSGTSPPFYILHGNQVQIDGCFVRAQTSPSIQELDAEANHVYIGNGQVTTPPALGGAFCLQSDANSKIVGNKLAVTGTDTTNVVFLQSAGQNGTVGFNNITNAYSASGVTANGVQLQTGSTGWTESLDTFLGGLTTPISDAGTGNNTSLSPLLFSPNITGGMVVTGNLVNGNGVQLSNTSVLAAAGTTLATATALVKDVTTVTTGTGGVLLTQFLADQQIVLNSTSAAINVYPNSSSVTINGGTAGAPVSLAAGAMEKCLLMSSTNVRCSGY